MTPPRYVVPDQLVLVTMSAANRSFRFLPTRCVVAILWFVFAYFVEKCGIQIHEFEYMSSHLHFVATDKEGKLPMFMGRHNSLLSRALNALRGIVGINIEGYSVQEIVDDEAALEASVYTLTNAIEEDLVARVKQWAGPNSLRLDYGQTIRIPRPTFSLWGRPRPPRKRGKYASKGRAARRGESRMPEFVEFTLVRPPICTGLEDAALRQLIRDRVGERERDLIEDRRRTGRRAGRMSDVLRYSYLHIAKSTRVLFERPPRIKGTKSEAITEAIGRHERFMAWHQRSSKRFRKGERNVEFPRGTWLMRVRFNARCATAPP